MKKVVRISFILSLLALVSACQKDEFTEEFDAISRGPEAKIIVTNNSKGNDGSTSVETDTIEITEPIIGMVKEVSDGDDEADSGDDSKSKD